MRPLVAVAGAIAVVVIGVVFLWPAPSVGPEAITHGRDACAQCRMPLTRPGFAGELRDHAGVLTKYDDLGCMLRAMLATHEEIPGAWVEDHVTFDLVPLLGATIVQTADVETPMASGLVAFVDADAAAAFARAHGAEVVALETLLRDPGRLAAASSRRSAAIDSRRER
jgi:copper chaperone NosL